MMPSGSEFCSECGAPLTDAPGVVGSDAEVYPELARANLLRMRREFKAAEDACLAILRRYPNNSSANTLLGDIACEKGELEQAVEWYELALDLVPDSVEVKQKLAEVKQQLAEQQTQTTAEAIGIPDRQPPIGLYAMIGIVVLGLAIAGVMLSRRPPDGPKEDPNKPVVVGKNSPPPTPIPDKAEPKPAAPQTYHEDAVLAGKICTEVGIDAAKLPLVEIGDTDSAVRTTLSVTASDGEWITRARVVVAAFSNSQADKVELTVLQDHRKTTQVVERSTFEKTLSADFDKSNDALLVETLLDHKLEPVPDTTAADPGGAPTTNANGTPPVNEDSKPQEKPADDQAAKTSGG